LFEIKHKMFTLQILKPPCIPPHHNLSHQTAG
jgi:hypothetical protein